MLPKPAPGQPQLTANASLPALKPKTHIRLRKALHQGQGQDKRNKQANEKENWKGCLGLPDAVVTQKHGKFLEKAPSEWTQIKTLQEEAHWLQGIWNTGFQLLYVDYEI